MSVDVRHADGDDRARWDDWLDRAPGGTVFHRRAALETMVDHSGTDLVELVGYVGEEPVGLLPVFVRSVGPLSAAFSPPPNLRIPYLGPVHLNVEKLKPRRAERRRRRFLEGCLEWLEEHYRLQYLHVRTGVAFPDVRPFAWNDCDVTPAHTYVVDLTRGETELLNAFSSDARANVRDGADAVDVRVGGPEAIDAVIDEVAARYAQQGLAFHLSADVVRDLYRRLGDDRVLPYVCTDDGEFLGGIVVVADDDTAYRWQGGVKSGSVDHPVNDLLDWRIMRDAADRGLAEYDLVGAENPRINKYKSKFAPELRTHYSVEKRGQVTGPLADLYRRVNK